MLGRFALATLALTAALSLPSAAIAATPDSYLKASTPHMGNCCVEAAHASKACCGKDAETIAANYADYELTRKAQAVVLADTHACCAKALKVGEACCGHDATELKLEHAKKVVSAKAALMVQADMHACCAKSAVEGKACCGQEAQVLKAGYDERVAAKTQSLLMMY